jgi:D-alanyl-D-alanine dipeptidase
MYQYTGKNIFVRKSVLQKLKEAAINLKQINSSYKLQIVCGYRALDIQKNIFKKYAKQLSTKYKGKKLMEVVHRLIAVPDVAGHPTGGAVDVQIVKNQKELNMGTTIINFSKNSYTFSPFISKIAWRNRQMLRFIMTKSGFAPFDGEWWHYSYGDKEWASYYNESYAIYSQLDFKSR